MVKSLKKTVMYTEFLSSLSDQHWESKLELTSLIENECKALMEESALMMSFRFDDTDASCLNYKREMPDF